MIRYTKKFVAANLLVAVCLFLGFNFNAQAQNGADIEAHEIFIGDYYPEGEHPVTLYYINHGPGSVKYMTVNWRVNNGTVHSETVYDLEAVSSSIFLHSITTQGTFSINGNEPSYTLQVWLSEPDGEIDPNNSNNSLSKTITKLDNACESFVLLETHLGVSNSFSPDVELQLEEILETYPNQVLVAAIHTDDDMEIPGISQQIMVEANTGYDMYFSDGIIDRYSFPPDYIGQNIKPTYERETWDRRLDQRFNFYRPMHLSASKSFNPSTREMTIDIDATFLADLQGDIRFNCYIMENPVIGSGPGYAQNNRYSYEGPTSEGYMGEPTGEHPYYNYPTIIEGFPHRNVVWDMLGGAWGSEGSIPPSVTKGQSVSQRYNYVLPENIDINEAYLIVMVQEYNTAIEQRRFINTLRCDLNTSNQHEYLGAVASASSNVDIRMFLEGNYSNNGQMLALLGNMMPTSQPYNTAPYNYYGTESIAQVSGDMVDWVLVEAREGTPDESTRGTVTVESHAGILLRTGQVVDVNGKPIQFTKLIPNANYHFCVRHRNHLDVLTGYAVQATPNISFDFTAAPDRSFGPNQTKESSDGRYVLFAGDYTQNGIIDIADFDAWRLNPAQNGVYSSIDGTLDGVVQVTDFDSWYYNKAKVGVAELNY